MTSAVLVVALSISGQLSPQSPTKVAPAPQAPAKVAPAPQIIPAPQAPVKAAPQG